MACFIWIQYILYLKGTTIMAQGKAVAAATLGNGQ